MDLSHWKEKMKYRGSWRFILREAKANILINFILNQSIYFAQFEILFKRVY